MAHRVTARIAASATLALLAYFAAWVFISVSFGSLIVERGDCGLMMKRGFFSK